MYQHSGLGRLAHSSCVISGTNEEWTFPSMVDLFNRIHKLYMSLCEYEKWQILHSSGETDIQVLQMPTDASS